uniref:Uncharacterized protein n=1 Tax=Cannabis sativa TaxID=3483 RepID=A0A803QDV6_CANSA
MKLGLGLKSGKLCNCSPMWSREPFILPNLNLSSISNPPLKVPITYAAVQFPWLHILLEYTKEYISYAPKEETKAQDRRPFDLLVIINPKLQKKSNSRSSPFIEGSVEVQITLLNFLMIRRREGSQNVPNSRNHNITCGVTNHHSQTTSISESVQSNINIDLHCPPTRRHPDKTIRSICRGRQAPTE